VSVVKNVIVPAGLAAFCLFLAPAHLTCGGEGIWPPGLTRVRETSARPIVLARDGRPEADIVLLGNSELVRNAADWLSGFVAARTGARIPIGGAELLEQPRSHLVATIGEPPQVKRWAEAGKLHLEPRVGPQGFVVEALDIPAQRGALVCWSPEELGCRYGLIELLRSTRIEGKTAIVSLRRVVERPRFPVRICYVNFAEHLQNAFNPNVLFDCPDNRWSREDWERFIDMVSAFRYNIFEFWLVPTLFAPEALHDGAIQRQFAETINHVIAYGKRRGVAVHPIQTVNIVGREWRSDCPKDPREHAEIVALWDHWSKAIHGNQSIGLFPGDPGGCTRNGCTDETYIDLCLELSKIVRRNNPGVKIEVGTWGEPMGGWGVPLWTGTPARAAKAMRNFLGKLPEFPEGTFTSINLGFSPDCLPTTHGGDGRPYARDAARICPVLTWDYSVTEGEGTVSLRCRVRRMFERRREEAALGFYSGGICYTMAPRLQCLSLFCCAEAWWDPARPTDDVLRDFGRLEFGEQRAEIGPLLEEFEVIPDWGYYPPFPYTPARLGARMARLLQLIESVDPTVGAQLPLAPTPAEYRRDLRFFAALFRKLAGVATAVEEVTAAAKSAGVVPAGRTDLVALDELEERLAENPGSPDRAQLEALAGRLRRIDVRGLTRDYWNKVYRIYEVIPHPVDPRAQGATSALFSRFHCQLATAYPPSLLEKALRGAGRPFVLLHLGRPGGPRGWKMEGWTVQGEDGGETWQASFDQPGRIVRGDVRDPGYRWLTVRLTEGPKGSRKTIAVNGRVIGQFVRTGPPASEKKEWWVTRSYPLPPGLLEKSGPLEVRFTDPGIAISEVALSVEPVPGTDH
jgi:hypothetical protein